MKFVSKAEQAVIKKDFSEIWDVKMVRSTLIVLPIILAIFLPVVYICMLLFVPQNQMNGVDQIIQLLPQSEKNLNVQQAMFYIMTNILSPMFFLMIPLMSSTVSAACSFVGEKERKTMETLLLTPLSVKSIFKSKVLGCTVLSVIVTGISFAVFCAVIGAGDYILQMPFFFNWNWLVLIALLAPAFTIFGVIFMVLVSGKSKSYMEAIQLSGYIVLPIILLFVGQFTGLFQLNAWILLIVGVLITALDFVLWIFASRMFTPEKLLK
jgi:ABC-type Na+ efflux pump permease subunit